MPFISLPHARGGVSEAKIDNDQAIESSPRPWGCFWELAALPPRHSVFPTPVGVFPIQSVVVYRTDCLPHARGGVSTSMSPSVGFTASSPRPWGCF